LRSSFVLLGIAILIVGLSTLLQLSKITPYEFFKCSPYEGGTQCFGSINPIYWLVFFTSMAGAVLFFFGLFGRGFILGPFFILGMPLVAFGLVGVIFGYIGYGSCNRVSCITYHPELLEPFILAGVALLAVNAYQWYSGLGVVFRASRQTLSRFLGVVSVITGAILLLFGWVVVATFVGNYVADHTLSWLQIASGLWLMPVGTSLIAWSFKVRR